MAASTIRSGMCNLLLPHVACCQPGMFAILGFSFSRALRVCREAYARWQQNFAQYGLLAPRACRVCTTIYSWYQRNLPAVEQSFRYPIFCTLHVDHTRLKHGRQSPQSTKHIHAPGHTREHFQV